jgi:hypothetical protein
MGALLQETDLQDAAAFPYKNIITEKVESSLEHRLLLVVV